MICGETSEPGLHFQKSALGPIYYVHPSTQAA